MGVGQERGIGVRWDGHREVYVSAHDDSGPSTGVGRGPGEGEGCGDGVDEWRGRGPRRVDSKSVAGKGDGRFQPTTSPDFDSDAVAGGGGAVRVVLVTNDEEKGMNE